MKDLLLSLTIFKPDQQELKPELNKKLNSEFPQKSKRELIFWPLKMKDLKDYFHKDQTNKVMKWHSKRLNSDSELSFYLKKSTDSILFQNN